MIIMKWLVAILILTIVLIAGCTQQDQRCGIEQCNGLELTCGADMPQECAAVYKLGDFCREYFAGCEIVNGICTKKIDTSADVRFFMCKTCASDCEKLSDPTKAFECESDCRDLMKKYCEQDSDCACGKSIETGDCFYGNKAFVNTSQQCPDFCTGIAGNLVIKCVDNTCKQSRTE
jgi:hypothetical protein